MTGGYADSGHIISVEFDPKVKIYWWLGAMLAQVVTVIGIPLAFLWLIIGLPIHQKQFEGLSCALTDRSLNIRMGWLFKKQQNIPLATLTDVSIHEGPILNAFGVLCFAIVLGNLPSILESHGYEAIDAAKTTMLTAAIVGLISAFIFYKGLKGGVPEDSEEVAQSKPGTKELISVGLKSIVNPKIALAYGATVSYTHLRAHET